MASFAFKYFTIQSGGTPQPVIGTYLTASITQPVINAANPPGNDYQNPVTMTVADSSMFVGFNWLNVIDVSTYATERAEIITVPSSTTVTVQGLKNIHTGGSYGTGAWVSLGVPAQSLYIQGLDGNSGSLYIGTSPQMSKSTGLYVIAKMVIVTSGLQPYDFCTSRQGLADTEVISQYWIDGTTGDSYLPSIGAV
jgi:hypothetical protein